MVTSSMLRGFLRIFVLKELDEGKKSGYELMKHIGERMGAKPSPGSIYPLLENLEKEGLVEFKGDKRSKEYHLTAEGRKKLQIIDQKREECIKGFLSGMKMLSALTGEDMTFPMAMVESMKKGEVPFKEINPEWDRLRDNLFVMMKTGTLKEKSPKIRRILAKTTTEMKAL